MQKMVCVLSSTLSILPVIRYARYHSLFCFAI
jgi:hypothetical protein